MKNFNVYLLCLIGFTILFSSCSSGTSKRKENLRMMALEGAYNVRDLGGYPTADGKKVKWNKTLRSGDLNLLTKSDLEHFENMNLKTIIDFRDSNEIAQAADRLPTTLKNSHLLSIDAGSIIEMQSISEESAPTLLAKANIAFVKDFQDQYREFFRILQNEKSAPLLFHCSAGKDRTGYAAAMFLSSLGVDREVIMEDYLLSAELVKEKYDSIVSAFPVLEPLMTVRPEYLQAAFDEIDLNYGGTEKYLTDCLNVDLELMRKLYTE